MQIEGMLCKTAEGMGWLPVVGWEQDYPNPYLLLVGKVAANSDPVLGLRYKYDLAEWRRLMQKQSAS